MTRDQADHRLVGRIVLREHDRLKGHLENIYRYIGRFIGRGDPIEEKLVKDAIAERSKLEDDLADANRAVEYVIRTKPQRQKRREKR